MAKPRIISVIDIGSNSTVLLVANCDSRKQILPINEVYATTKLLEGVENSGVLSEESMSLTLQALKEMKQISIDEGSDDLIATVSSGIRKAENRSEFLVRCHNELDIFPQVLSLKDEENYSFLGVVNDINWDGPILTIDVGGNSTQIAYGSSLRMEGSHSIPVGCVSLNNAFGLSKGAWIHNWIQAKRHIRKSLFSCVDDINTWIAGRKILVITSGGTAVSYAAILIKDSLFDRKEINSTTSYLKEVSAMARQISRTPLAKRYIYNGLDMRRAEVLPAGLLIIASILDFFNLNEFRISANGLRFGILLNYLKA